MAEPGIALTGPHKAPGGEGDQDVVEVVPGTLLGGFANQFLPLNRSLAITGAINVESQDDQFGLLAVHDLDVQVLVIQEWTRDSPLNPGQVHVLSKGRMNIEPLDVVFVSFAVQNSELYLWVGHARKWIPVVLLSGRIGLALVHDSIVGNVRLVALLKGDVLGIGRDPKPLVPGHFFHCDEIRKTVHDATRGIVGELDGSGDRPICRSLRGCRVQLVFAHKYYHRSVVAHVRIDDASGQRRRIDNLHQFVFVFAFSQHKEIVSDRTQENLLVCTVFEISDPGFQLPRAFPAELFFLRQCVLLSDSFGWLGQLGGDVVGVFHCNDPVVNKGSFPQPLREARIATAGSEIDQALVVGPKSDFGRRSRAGQKGTARIFGNVLKCNGIGSIGSGTCLRGGEIAALRSLVVHWFCASGGSSRQASCGSGDRQQVRNRK
mmetsp:Transcript_7481/g.18715  ORF Transcript_7481/g.18715 Transcript_7481/m.18715 type:complete len:433 (+) Transcript_7481:29-1327(+)